MQGLGEAYPGIFLPESLVGLGGILTPTKSASQSQSGSRSGSPSRTVLESGCDRSAGADGSPPSSLTTNFTSLDLSTFFRFHSEPSDDGVSSILQRTAQGSMDFNGLGVFDKRQDGSSSSPQQQNQHHHSQPQPGQSPAGASNPNAVNLEALQQLLSMQMQMPLQYPQQTQQGTLEGNSTELQSQNQLRVAMQGLGSDANGAGRSTGETSPAAVLIYEQQMRVQQLQQLQQLQNQIFQQQLELLNGQNGGLDGTTSPLSLPNTGQFHGLPTPVNSTELRPQTQVSFVTPAYIHSQGLPYPQFNTPGVSPTHNSSSNAAHSHIQLPLGSSSAPAHLAFASHSSLGMGDMELELSPITSPWLAPIQYQQQTEQQMQPQQTQAQIQQQQPQTPIAALGMAGSATRNSNSAGAKKKTKRGASDSGDDGTSETAPTSHARKRQSAGRLGSSGSNILSEGSSMSGGRRGAYPRGSASVGSTPVSLGRGRGNSEAVADTPSPVDLSMPPPTSTSSTSVSATTEGNNFSLSLPENSAVGTSPALSPVTPASIMNLGRLGLGSGLSPPLNTPDQQDSRADTSNKSNSASNSKGKSKVSSSSRPTTRRASTSASITLQQQTTSKPQTQITTQSLKPLLPGGVPPSSASALASSSNYTHHLSGGASSLNLLPSTPLPLPLPAIRKSSHKVAEQKRRDSLKTSFDALRSLLPPLVLPNDENYSGEAPLPGALPPRGPPKGGEGGANRMASKLQLLRAGNEFIAVLKGRVERRERYIGELREEVEALRQIVREQERQRRGRGRQRSLPLGQGKDGDRDDDDDGNGNRDGEEEEGDENVDPVERILASLNVKMVDLNLDLEVCEEGMMGSAGQMRLRAETIMEGDEADDEDA